MNSSPAWEYFERIDDDYIKCRLCNERKKQPKSSGTTNAVKHLRSVHHLDIHSEHNYAKRAANDKTILTQEEKERLLLDCICIDYQPFSVVEDKGFRKLVSSLDPTFVLPSRKKLSNELLTERYEDVLNKLKNCLDGASHVCLTADSWTSSANIQYLAVTCHLIDIQYEYKSVLLDVIEIESHTSAAIAKNLVKVISDYHLTGKVVCLVTDNASDMKLAASLSHLAWVGCVAHKLNLVVQDLLKSDEIIIKLRQDVREIVSSFRRSPKQTSRLSKFIERYNLPKLKLKLECETRWNSCYHMFERFSRLRVAIIECLDSSPDRSVKLSSQQYELLAFLLKVLKPFEKLSSYFSASDNVYASMLIYLSSQLVSELDSVECFSESHEKYLQLLRASLKRRGFMNFHSDKLFALPTLLDPRIKSEGFATNSARDAAKDFLVRELHQYDRSSSVQLQLIPENDDDSNNTNGIFSELIARKNRAYELKRNTSSAIVEINRYLSENSIPLDENPLLWWKTRSSVYPTLSRAALKYLTIVTNSVPCERIFSKLGLVLTDRRSRLSSSQLKMIALIHCNNQIL